ncbi:MAG: ABC transporter permease [Actinomycetes bacterium]
MIPPAGGDCLERNAWICGKYLTTRKHQIFADLHQHIDLVIVSVLVGLVIAVPLALLVRRWRRAEGTVMGTTSALYSVPSLALFAIFVPITGLTTRTVQIGLIVYTLVILVRNTLAGLDGVPPDVIEAARGMGYGRLRLFAGVELPLALPSIIGGVRIATVSTVALATVGAVIGHGGLGNELADAIGSNFKAEALVASVLCVALALLADALLLGVERLLTPWRRRRTTS